MQWPLRRGSLLVRCIMIMGMVVVASFFVSPAAAAQPTKNEFTFTASDVISGVCEYPIGFDATLKITEIIFVNESGAVTRSQWHVAQQDTFTANGKTLMGLPYNYKVDFLPDSDGNLVPVYATGIIEKVPLPDGSLFITAGWVDYAAHPDVWIFSADRGNPGNVAAFCAALAP